LLLSVPAEFGRFVVGLGRAFLFPLASAFGLIALLLLTRLLFLTFVEG
jgi:hypothetical protein